MDLNILLHVWRWLPFRVAWIVTEEYISSAGCIMLFLIKLLLVGVVERFSMKLVQPLGLSAMTHTIFSILVKYGWPRPRAHTWPVHLYCSTLWKVDGNSSYIQVVLLSNPIRTMSWLGLFVPRFNLLMRKLCQYPISRFVILDATFLMILLLGAVLCLTYGGSNNPSCR